MCGICGVVALGRPPEPAVVAGLSAALGHRGPDGEGAWSSSDGVALGHRRLAIIDLSDAGLQPFASADGLLQLVYNGEIYNYRELREELAAQGHRFRTATDTEVLLAAYEEWGERCVERFNGMWAFALWDGRRRRLLCSRDRFGIKPLYYRWAGGRFVFASELKAFQADPGHVRRANLRMVADYLEQGYLDHTAETFFEGVLQLPPACSLTLDASGLSVRRHWVLERRDPPAGDPVAAVRELLVDAVRVHLRGDVAVGTCLSGGLDSSAITCIADELRRSEAEPAARVGLHQRTFTAWFEGPGYDERPYARAVVERTGADAHWITFDDRDLVDSLPSIVRTQDEPFGSSSIVAQWYVMRAAAETGVKVMLDGQGGDEVLAGYPVYAGARFADLLAAGRLPELAAELAAYRRLHGAGAAALLQHVLRPFLPTGLKWWLRSRQSGAAQLAHADLPRSLPGRDGAGRDGGDRLHAALKLILTGRGLPELLHYEDRNSMAWSLEARVPFLDVRLVELLHSLDGGDLIRRGMTKSVLRRALADVLPPAVRDRVDKLGFVTPGGRFLRGALGDLAADAFASQAFRERGLVDPAAAQRRLAEHRAGRAEAGQEVWRALNLELWARTFLDGGAA